MAWVGGVWDVRRDTQLVNGDIGLRVYGNDRAGEASAGREEGEPK